MKQLHLPVLRGVLRFCASDFKGRLKVECVQIRERIAELMEHVYPAHAHLDVDLVGLLHLQLLNVFNRCLRFKHVFDSCNINATTSPAAYLLSGKSLLDIPADCRVHVFLNLLRLILQQLVQIVDP
jgi:hypothetical protein